MNKTERAVLVDVSINKEKIDPYDLVELEALAKTAGARSVGEIVQSRESPDGRYYIGKGKVDELKALCASTNSDLVIFNNELSPSQIRNLQDELHLKVIDRTGLILDIFAQHAHTREGKLQVELAQDNYTLTHLSGKGIELSRLGGGIGTRGPGETKLEMDRRRIRNKIAALKNELEEIRLHRSRRRERRRQSKTPVAAIVGYTNAGKSTLLNTLTKAGVSAENKLFATLDPVTRILKLPGNKEMLLTDTVGFIQDLPHDLIEAFQATLEEVTEADLLIHIVDISHPNFIEQISSTYKVLEELSAITKPMLTVFNKIDRYTGNPKVLLNKYSPAVIISALKGEGMEELIKSIIKLI
ncbi:MAG: GTPase HflX [bacterium]